jgi:hypothetical protein
MNRFSSEELLTRVVTGNAEWSDLASIGIELSYIDGICHLAEPPDIPVVSVSSRDVAEGFMAHWARSTSLASWAQAMLAANFIDLDQLEQDDQEHSVLDLLWKAAAQESFQDNEIAFLRWKMSQAD